MFLNRKWMPWTCVPDKTSVSSCCIGQEFHRARESGQCSCTDSTRPPHTGIQNFSLEIHNCHTMDYFFKNSIMSILQFDFAPQLWQLLTAEWKYSFVTKAVLLTQKEDKVEFKNAFCKNKAANPVLPLYSAVGEMKAQKHCPGRSPESLTEHLGGFPWFGVPPCRNLGWPVHPELLSSILTKCSKTWRVIPLWSSWQQVYTRWQNVSRK